MLPHLRRPQPQDRRSRKIVNVGSDSSHIGYPLLSAYTTSKHAIVALTRPLAEEVGRGAAQLRTRGDRPVIEPTVTARHPLADRSVPAIMGWETAGSIAEAIAMARGPMGRSARISMLHHPPYMIPDVM